MLIYNVINVLVTCIALAINQALLIKDKRKHRSYIGINHSWGHSIADDHPESNQCDQVLINNQSHNPTRVVHANLVAYV